MRDKRMTPKDYEHLSRILDSYILQNDERRRCFVYSELVQIARLRNEPLETVTQETATAVGEQANNQDIKELIRRRMIPVKKTLIELLHIIKLADQAQHSDLTTTISAKEKHGYGFGWNLIHF